MLESLKLANVGPAPQMTLHLAPRFNLFTGDNGLGKSFLLDVAWWALTQSWPQEVNPRMTSGLPAQPRDHTKAANIHLQVLYDRASVECKADYSMDERMWMRDEDRPWARGIVVYAHADGSFSVWDPIRNYGKERIGIVAMSRRPAYVFTEAEVWDGLWDQNATRPVPVCNGLLYDWANWINAQDREAEAMATILRALAPTPAETFAPGPLVRLSLDDARAIPSLVTHHAGPVPVLHASAGVRRAVALAYMLTWAYTEHQLAAKQTGRSFAQQVIILFDEVESHLHPRWQRSILTSLQEAGSAIFAEVDFQYLVSTHSPLVLASAKSWFDAEKDAWFDIDLAGDPPQVCLQKRPYVPLGTAGHWLTSEAFDLATDRGSVEAEDAILKAKAILREPEPALDAVMEVDDRLRRTLPELDPFWVRWNAFVEQCGAEP